MGRSILTLLRGCAPLVLGDTCPVWCPKVFWVLRPNCSSQEHHQQTAETSFPLIPLSIHLSNVLLFKQSQAAQEVHAQLTAFRIASSKFSLFYFLMTPFSLPHLPPLCRKLLWHAKCQRQQCSCHKNRCFFNCPSLRHNWLNEGAHKIDCSTRVKGGSFPRLVQEGKKNLPLPAWEMQ